MSFFHIRRIYKNSTTADLKVTTLLLNKGVINFYNVDHKDTLSYTGDALRF